MFCSLYNRQLHSIRWKSAGSVYEFTLIHFSCPCHHFRLTPSDRNACCPVLRLFRLKCQTNTAQISRTTRWVVGGWVVGWMAEWVFVVRNARELLNFILTAFGLGHQDMSDEHTKDEGSWRDATFTNASEQTFKHLFFIVGFLGDGFILKDFKHIDFWGL